MLKSLLISMTFIITLSATASSNMSPLLKCLAKEEEMLHKQKIHGAIYKLNRKLISTFASNSGLKLKKNEFKKICTKNGEISINLLRSLMVDGTRIFSLSKDSFEKQMDINASESIMADAPNLFTVFLADLQSMTSAPNCLVSEIPELTYFFDRFKYLQTEYSPKNLLEDKAKIKKVFKKLEDFNGIINKCKK